MCACGQVCGYRRAVCGGRRAAWRRRRVSPFPEAILFDVPWLLLQPRHLHRLQAGREARESTKAAANAALAGRKEGGGSVEGGQEFVSWMQV